MAGDLDAAEKDYAISVELGHIPATAKLRALRKQKELQEAAGGGARGMAMIDAQETGRGRGSATVLVRYLEAADSPMLACVH